VFCCYHISLWKNYNNFMDMALWKSNNGFMGMVLLVQEVVL
jgi:hypothetical protein